MNWKQLKEFCNKLPENQLENNVILWRENECVNTINAEELSEDHYIDLEDSDNGCFSFTDAKSFIKDKDAYPNGFNDLKIVYKKGHPVLWEEFLKLISI